MEYCHWYAIPVKFGITLGLNVTTPFVHTVLETGIMVVAAGVPRQGVALQIITFTIAGLEITGIPPFVHVIITWYQLVLELGGVA